MAQLLSVVKGKVPIHSCLAACLRCCQNCCHAGPGPCVHRLSKIQGNYLRHNKRNSASGHGLLAQLRHFRALPACDCGGLSRPVLGLLGYNNLRGNCGKQLGQCVWFPYSVRLVPEVVPTCFLPLGFGCRVDVDGILTHSSHHRLEKFTYPYSISHPGWCCAVKLCLSVALVVRTQSSRPAVGLSSSRPLSVSASSSYCVICWSTGAWKRSRFCPERCGLLDLLLGLPRIHHGCVARSLWLPLSACVLVWLLVLRWFVV